MEIKKYFIVLIGFALVGCARSASSDLMNPNPEYESITESNQAPEYDFSPKAEIVFVLDNSSSMKVHLSKVSENIDKFVSAFTYKNPIEYRLAAVSVYDTRTFNMPTYVAKFRNQLNFFEMGQFRPVKDRIGNIINGKNFISSDDANASELIPNTLKIGALDYHTEGGPEMEEAFSPIAALYGKKLKDAGQKAKDSWKGFSYGEDSYKVVFFVTDATDASTISAGELYTQLLSASKGDHKKVMSFGAIIPTNETSGCKRDPGDLPYKIEEFLKLTRVEGEASNVTSLCGDFGAQFASFGKSIRQRAVALKIPLKKRLPIINDNPDETLRVFYGEQEIPMETSDKIVGFKYDPSSNSIYLNPALEFQEQKGAKIRIKYTEIDPRDVR